MWSRKVVDSTTMASTQRATGFLGLFLLRRLLNQEDRCSSCETGSTVLLSEKPRQNLNPKFLAEPNVSIALPAATVLKRSSFTNGKSSLVASGAPADAPFQDRNECTLSLITPRQWCRRSQGHFFGYFLWGLAKKVSRLPAGTGELEFRIVSF
jgi:hypothetical protein